MIDRKIIELINLKIDGKATPEERMQLEKAIDRHPEIRNTYNEIARVTGILESVAMVEPPADLRDRILDSLPSDKYTSNVKESIWQKIQNTLVIKTTLRPAFSFALGLTFGLIIAIVASTFFEVNSIKNSEVSGTISVNRKLNQHLVVNNQLAVGTIDFEQTNGRFLLQFNLQSEQSVELSVVFQNNVKLLSAINHGNGFTERFLFSENSVQTAINGKVQFNLLFETDTKMSSQARIIFRAGALFYEKTIDVDEPYLSQPNQLIEN